MADYESGVEYATTPGSDGSAIDSTARSAASAAQSTADGAVARTIFGRLGNIVAVAGDYTSTLITNASSVAGSTVTAALNALLAMFGAYTVNNQVGTTYTLALTDAGNLVTCNNASAITVTIPANISIAFPVGSLVEIMQIGAGQVTVGITSDTLNGPGLTLKTRTQYSSVVVRKISSTVWVISGDLA